jgi:hypothetical protein
MSEVYNYRGFLYGNGYNAGTTMVISDSKARADVVHFAFFSQRVDLLDIEWRTDRALSMKDRAAAAAKYVPVDLAEAYEAVDYALPWYLGDCTIDSPVPLEPLIGTDLELELDENGIVKVSKAKVLMYLDDSLAPDHFKLWYAPDGLYPTDFAQLDSPADTSVLDSDLPESNTQAGSSVSVGWRHPDWSSDGYMFILLSASATHSGRQCDRPE